MSRLLKILRILSVCFISVFSAHAAFGATHDIWFYCDEDWEEPPVVRTYEIVDDSYILVDGYMYDICPGIRQGYWDSVYSGNTYSHNGNKVQIYTYDLDLDSGYTEFEHRGNVSFCPPNAGLGACGCPEYAIPNSREGGCIDKRLTTNSDSTLTCYNEEGGVDIASDFVFTANNIHAALQEGCTDYLPSGEEYAGFEVWGVDADGNFSDDVLATCNAGEDCTIEDSQGYTTFDFYAISAVAQATMNFSCGTGATGSISAKTVNVGTSVSFSNLHNSCTRSGYRPTGWSNGSTTIALNGSYTPTTTSTQTWTLQWTTASTLTFNRNGGSWSGPSSGKYATYPTITSYGYPTRSGYVFTGFNNSAAKQVYDQNLNLNSSFRSTTITANTTLYAQWAQAKCVQNGDHFVGTATPTISNNTVSCNFQCDNYYSPSTTASGGTVTATCVADTLSDSSEKIIALDFQGGSSSAWTYSKLYYLPTYGFVCTSKPCTINNVIASADGTINKQIDSQFLPTLSGYTFAGYYIGGPHLGNMSNGVEKQSISTGKMFITPDRRVNMNFSSINSHVTVYAKWIQNCNSTANGCSPSFTENGTNIDLSYACDAGYKYDISTGTCIVPPYNIYYMCEEDGNYDDNGHPINPAQTVVSTIGKSETILDVMSTCTSQNPNMIFTGWEDLDTGKVYNVNEAFNWSDINTDYDSTVLIAQWSSPSCIVTNGTLISTSISENRVSCAVSCNTGYSKDGQSNFTETGNAGVASVSVSCVPRTYNITYSVSPSSGYSTIANAAKTYTYGTPQTIGMNIDSPNENALYTWTATYTNTGAIYKENQFPLIIDAGAMGDLTLTPKWTVGTDACAITNTSGLNAVFADNSVTCSGTCKTGYNMNNSASFSNLTGAVATPVSGECVANTFRVDYLCGNGTGTAPERVQCTYGDASCVAAQNTCAAPELNSFMGWTYTDANGVTQTIAAGADMSTITSENGKYVTLTAKFEKNLLYVCRDMNADGRCDDRDRKTTCTIGGLIGSDYFAATGAETQTFNSWYIDGTEEFNRYYGTGPYNNVGQQICQTGIVSPILTDTIFIRPLMCNTTIEDETGRGTLDNNVMGKCNYNIVCQDGYSQTGGTDTTNEFFMNNEYGVTEINPICSPRVFKVTYNAGRVTNTVDVTYNTQFTPLDADVPKEGYTHIGWTDSAVDGATFTRGQPVQYLFTTDLTLDPTYTPNTYTVSFDANGGTGGQTSNVTVTYGAGLPGVSAPTRKGYVFDGWYDMKTGGTKYYDAVGEPVVAGWNIGYDTTLYAHWTANPYTVTLDCPDTSDVSDCDNVVYYLDTDDALTTGYYSDLACTQKLDTVPVPVSAGKTFVGYFMKNGANDVNNVSKTTSFYSVPYIRHDGSYSLRDGSYISNIVEDTDLYALWAYDCASVTNGTCDLSFASPGAGQFEITYTTTCNDGYTIGGNGTSTPTCTPTPYTVTFWCDDTKGDFTSRQTITIESGDIDLANLLTKAATDCNKSGYTPIAWKYNDDTIFTDADTFGYAQLDKGASEQDMVAQWEMDIYTLTLDDNNGAGGDEVVYYAPAIDKWCSDSNCESYIDSATIPTRDNYRFIGYYRPTGAEIDKDFSNADSDISVKYNGEFTAGLTENQYAYASWARECEQAENGTCELVIDDAGVQYITTPNTGYQAVNPGRYNTTYTPKTYTITYRVGNVYPVVTVQYGEKFTTYQAYPFPDKTQTAWVSADGSIRLGLNTEYTYEWDTNLVLDAATEDDVTCSAGYYLTAGGTSCTICPENSYCLGGTYKYDATNAQGIASCPANSTASGTGNATCACNTGYSVDGTASGDKTTTATACQDIYIVQSYDSNGGNGTLSTNSCKYKTSCEPRPPYTIGTSMTRAGHVFAGWGETPESTTPVDWRNGFETDVTLYAIWEPCAAGTYKYATDAAQAACKSCTDGTYSESGARQCTNCPRGYSTSGDYAGIASCKITCSPGQYISGSGGACLDVGTDYYGAGGTASYGQILARNKCETGLTTIGYGAGADEIGDCGRKLHIKDKTIYLRSVKKTYPSLHVEIDGREYYGNLSETINGLLKLSRMEEGVEKTYSVVDDSMQ